MYKRQGIHTLDISRCTRITDAGLAHLTGIHTLTMRGCARITNAGLAHLTGIHTLNMSLCDRITNAGLAHLTGVIDGAMAVKCKPTRPWCGVVLWTTLRRLRDAEGGRGLLDQKEECVCVACAKGIRGN